MPALEQNGHLKISKEFLLEIGGWRSMKEGRALWESSKVVEVSYEPPMLHGIVQAGTSSVKARLMVGKRLADVENLCSCRQAREYGTVCAHVIALGLEFIEREKGARNGNGNGNGHGHLLDPIAPAKPALAPPVLPKLHALPRAEAPSTAKQLALSVILPADLAEAWQKGEIRVVCEASLDGHHPKPLDSISRDPLEAYALSDGDLHLLHAIEKINGGDSPSVWLLQSNYFSEFFSALVGHPGISLGKKTQLQVFGLDRPSTLHLDILQWGELQVHLEENIQVHGTLLVSPLGHWYLDQGILQKVNSLPAAYHSLRQQDIVIPRDHLANFFQRELPNLEHHLRIVSSQRCKDLQFSKLNPQIRVTLDGMLSGLSCRLEAVYKHRTQLLSGHPGDKAKPDDQWTPDPENPLRYFIRDRQAEYRAKHDVLAAGFKPGERQPELYTLASEQQVGFFLANLLPRWQQKWKVEMTERMGGFIAKCDFIQPEVTITGPNSGEDWLSLDVEYRANTGNAQLSHAEIARLLEARLSHQRLNSGRIILLPTQSVQQFKEVITDCQVQQNNGSIRVDRRFSSYLQDALKANNWVVHSQTAWEPPSSIEAYAELELSPEYSELLRPYQKKGINWLHYLSRNGMGGILADEMGLGKTLQTLVYLNYRKQTLPPGKPCLIVCPTSLVRNWLEECNRFTPDLKALILQGTKRQALFEQIVQHDLIITSYALLRRDVAEYQKIDFDTIVLDEAQHIKNRSSQNAHCAKLLKGDHRLILTGTPIENSLFDLWSMFDFLMPGYLGPATDFRDRYEIPISKSHDEFAQTRLKQRVHPFILRRTKSEVAKDLPAKLEQIAFCELSDEQKQVYQMILEQGRREVFEHAGKNGQDKGQGRVAVLTALMRLRQVCCHLRMLPGMDDKTWNEPSAKMDYFMELLDQAVDGGHRILVFSQFVTLLKLIAGQLQARNTSFCYLDGSTLDRQGEVKKFQSDASIPVFLISLKAGGTGLNLTGADTVIHFDPWWNPAVEDQATARAHRIGQSKIVSSYKLIARGTVEEKIVNLQQKKKDLIANTLVSEEAFVQSLNWEDLQSLLE